MTEQLLEEAPSLVVAKLDQESFYLVLKEDNEHQKTYPHELVEYRADQLEFEYLRCDEPYKHEGEDAIEDVDGAALLHYPVEIKEKETYYGYVECVFYSKLIHGVGELVRGECTESYGLARLAHVVHSQDRGSAHQGNGVEDGGAVERFV